MTMRNFNKAGRVKVALKLLRQYNDYILFPVSDETFNDPLLVQYFETPLDDPIQKKVEKMLSAAAIKAVKDNPNIFKSKIDVCAKKNAHEYIEALRIVKLEYRARIKKDNITVADYEERKAAIPLVRKAARIKRLKKIGKSLTIRGFATAVCGAGAGIAISVSRYLWHFIPEKVREPLAKAAKKVKQEAIETIHECADYLKNTRVGKVVMRAVDKVEPYVHKAVKTIKAGAEKLRDRLVSLFA